MRPLILLLALNSFALAGAVEDWKKIQASDAGPGVKARTGEEGLRLGIEHAQNQERLLRAFLADYPDDPRKAEALLRLARVLSLLSELREQALPAEIPDLLSRAGEAASSPEERTEVEFAKLAHRMRKAGGRRPTKEERESLLAESFRFVKAHPSDRRNGALLAEVSTLFDSDVKKKEALLLEAKKRTRDPEILAQIADDTKRIGWLGRQLPLRFTGVDGKEFDIKTMRGKPVFLVFFATESAPARGVYQDLLKLAERQGAGFVGVSLDSNPATAAKFASSIQPSTIIACDGKSWESPFIQGLGINSIPTVWLLDKKGLVRTLDPLDDPEGLLRQLAR